MAPAQAVCNLDGPLSPMTTLIPTLRRSVLACTLFGLTAIITPAADVRGTLAA